LRSNHVLQCRAELDSEPPVGDKHKTNHQIPRGRVPVAPHERVLIMTIRSPSARDLLTEFWRLLHCGRSKSNRPAEAAFRSARQVYER
jgi:hypothetical protein